MILVADSGSTKCDWMYVRAPGRPAQHLESQGLNPTFHSQEIITRVVKKTFKDMETSVFKQVFFYGAGCSNEESCEVVRKGIQPVFPQAQIFVSHDARGSAIATCGNKEGIACILGTGSNACYWSGKDITPQIPEFGLGYILGDEGSGAYMGRKLLKSYFYNEMPLNLNILIKSMGITKAIVEDNVYRKPGANVYLASFAKFIHENKAHPFIAKLITMCFRDFFDTHVVQYKKHKLVPVNFVGSIAYEFQNELRQVAQKDYRVQVGNIIRRPIEHLLQYHNTAGVKS